MIKIFAVAPNEKIAQIIKNIGKKRDDTEIDCYVTNLEEAVNVVQQNCSVEYDVIIARGETAQMLKKVANIPVVELQLSFYDILQSIKIAQSVSEHFAIVGFEPVAVHARLISELLELQIPIYTVASLKDCKRKIKTLKKEKLDTVISGMGVDFYVRESGLNSVPISISDDTINSCINQAIHICEVYREAKKQYEFVTKLLEGSSFEVILYDDANKILLNSVAPINSKIALEMSKQMLKSEYRDGEVIRKPHQNTMISMRKKYIKVDDTNYISFYFNQEKLYFTPVQNEILIMSAESVITKYLNDYVENIEIPSSLTSETVPIMLIGTYGSMKNELAASIYAKESYIGNPLYIMDFELFTQKAWNYLTDNINSPINSNRITIYFANLNNLTSLQLKKIRDIILETNLSKRCKLIFSFTTDSDCEAIPNQIKDFINEISCRSVTIPSLNGNSEAIRTYADRVIEFFNLQNHRNIKPLNEKCQKLLLAYQWPQNYYQFKRVLLEILAETAADSVSERDLAEAIEKEKLMSFESKRSQPDYNKTLEEIERDIVDCVLKDTDGNQTKAAKRLGISRTTLWRILNR